MADSEIGQLAPEIAGHYDEGEEQNRLIAGGGQLEFERTTEIVSRYLPVPPAEILDIGGAAGIYSFWLAKQGYRAHLVDLLPLHIEQAREMMQQTDSPQLASLSVADARQLPFKDSNADAVLLMGPLYHLTEREERIKAIREAYRVLKPGGFLFAAGISRFASALDGMARGMLTNPDFVSIVERDLKEGQHRNPNNHPGWFTTAFLHHPEELKSEITDAGFSLEGLFGVEGPAWMVADLSAFWSNEQSKSALMNTLRSIESEPSLIGASAHLLAIGRKEK